MFVFMFVFVFVCYRQTAVLHWLVNGRVLDPGKSGDSESRVTANQRIAGYLFQVLIILTSLVPRWLNILWISLLIL